MTYKTSKDYERLYELVNNGFLVVGFVDFNYSGSKPPFPRDVVKIQRRGNYIDVGVRGRSYISTMGLLDNQDEKECFITDCNTVNLEFIDPDSQK